jgi:hypothetical protein
MPILHAMQQSVLSWDPVSEVEYPNMFAPEFKALASQLLLKILEAKMSERRSVASRKAELAAVAEKENKQDLFTRLAELGSLNKPVPELIKS